MRGVDGKGPDRIGAITELSMDAFKKWLREGDTMKAASNTILESLFTLTDLTAWKEGSKGTDASEHRGWAIAVNAAQYFSDILNIFNSAFPGIDYKGAFEDADRLKELLAVITSDLSDIIEKRNAANDLLMNQRFRTAGLHHTIAGTSPEDVLNIIKNTKELSGTLGDAYHDKWVAAGEAFVKSSPAFRSEEQVAAYMGMRNKIDTMKKEYDLAIAGTAEKWADEKARVSQECGYDAIEAEADMLAAENKKEVDAAWLVRPDPNTQYDAFVKWQNERIDADYIYFERQDALFERQNILREKYLVPLSEARNAEYETHEPTKKAIEAMQEEKRAWLQKAGEQAIDAILSDSSVSQEDAEKWAKGQVVTKSAMERLISTGTYKDKEDLCRDMAEFYRLTGGRLGPVIIQTTGRRRANAAYWTAEINIDNHFIKETLFHEMGHLLEKDETVRGAGQAYRDRRADSTKGIKKLSTLTGNRGYKSDEVAYTDDFWDPYVGKSYSNSVGSEVISMGIQMFSSPRKAGFLMLRDPQMFNLMIGIMESSQSEREKKQTAAFSEKVSTKQGEKANLESFYDKLSKFAKDEEKLLKHSSGLVHSIEGYGRGGRAGNGKSMVAYYYPGDPQGPGEYVQSTFFKTRQAARNFAYLYLLYIQKGLINSREEASRSTFFLADAVQKKKLPPRLKTEDMHKFIEDLK